MPLFYIQIANILETLPLFSAPVKLIQINSELKTPSTSPSAPKKPTNNSLKNGLELAGQEISSQIPLPQKITFEVVTTSNLRKLQVLQNKRSADFVDTLVF
ncbi:hypothetical protein CEXT_789101 [Caerostris extrusa]|uniref:Uncharacterized protein n=1 Tax=Caerostris extrusa TaxID=172846 RepID=A0AAV4TZB2_CAEEX|nr:hypothetical protein CEXT_789101 [Caerostris extrusa]